MLKYWVWLSELKGLRNQTKLALLRRFGDPESIFYADPDELMLTEGADPGQLKLMENHDLAPADKILADCQRLDIQLLTFSDAAYPGRLKNIYDPPALLYYKGKLPLLDDLLSVAVVGTRDCTPYGVACAEKLGYTQRLGAQSQRMMQSFFGNSLFGNDFFDDFFSPMPSLLGRRMKMLEDPFDDFFAEMPALSASPVQQQEAKQEKKDDLVGQEDQSRFAYLRQMNALKLEMKKAVHQENFERAAELRDQIRSLEAAHKEQKENK